MNDIFYAGYDLEKAGFNFDAKNSNNPANVALLNDIACDFVRISKSSIPLDKDAISEMLIDYTKSISDLMPIVILSVDVNGEVNRHNINRDNDVFISLFKKNV